MKKTMKKQIGLITIGQSPRDDVVPDMVPYIGSEVEILQRGALDGLSNEEAAWFHPGPGMFHLATRLGDGSEIIVAKEKILPRMADVVDEFNKEGVSLILLLCNGEFPRFESRALIIEPQRVVDQCLAGLLNDTHRLGILVPVPEQEEWVRTNLSGLTPRITTAVASPYGDESRLEEACCRFKADTCDLIALYCMGFNRGLGQTVRNLTDIPVLVSSTMVARTIGELLE